jgi:hypothetical protein
MADAHDEHEGHEGEHEADRPEYDPEHVDLPEREPPLRETAPQSDFTMGQVARGGAVAAVGLLLIFGLAFVLV